MLFKYLTDTSVAPLQQELVEIEEPFCGDVSAFVLSVLYKLSETQKFCSTVLLKFYSGLIRTVP